MADAYQVFNPQTGQHTRYETEAEAKAALVEVAKQILVTYTPSVVEETVHENGDVTWTSTELASQLIVSI